MNSGSAVTDRLDWRGETVVIAASGPSQRKDDLDRAKAAGCRIIAINNTWRLCPDADVLYASDRGWWECADDGYGQHALREFRGLMLAGRVIEGVDRIEKIGIAEVNAMLWTGVEIGGGGNGAFQATNVAILAGARRILLTGADCKANAEHWHGRHPSHLGQNHQFALWIEHWEKLARALPRRGVDVINCSRSTALTCFPRMTMEDAIGRRNRSAA